MHGLFCLNTSLCTLYVLGAHRVPERTGVKDPPCGCRQLHLSPLEEQQMLLNTEPSLPELTVATVQTFKKYYILINSLRLSYIYTMPIDHITPDLLLTLYPF